MALSLDGFAVFASMARHARTFADIRSEADKQARALIKKQIGKIKRGDITRLREVASALGSECFELFVDGMTEAELKSATTKYDPHNADLKAADARSRRVRLRDLSSGEAEPMVKAKPTPKVKGPPKPRAPRAKKAEPERIHSEAMRARKQRSPSDR